MKVEEVMTHNPVVCHPETSLGNVARLMREADCGAIPIVKHIGSHSKVMGIITDRDIVMRTLARGRAPESLIAESCMTKDIISVYPETDIEECIEKMERNRIRRILVLDHDGNCRGIISQADIALKVSTGETSGLVKELSKPSVRKTGIKG